MLRTHWHELREALLRRGLLRRLGSGELVLLRDLHALRLSELLRLFDWPQLDAVVDGEPDAFAQAQADRLRAALARLDADLDATVASLLEAPPATESA